MKKSTKATDSANKESVFQNLSKEERIALTVFFLFSHWLTIFLSSVIVPILCLYYIKLCRIFFLSLNHIFRHIL